MKPIRYILLALFVICLFLPTLAFAPAQTALPPVTPAPVAVVTPGPDAPVPSPFAGIVEIAATFVIGLLVAFTGWLVLQVRTLKAQGSTYIRKITSDDWEWILDNLAFVAVRAARQLFPPEKTDEMLKYAQKDIVAILKANGVPITDYASARIYTVIHAAVLDLYNEFPAAKPSNALRSKPVSYNSTTSSNKAD